MKVKSNVVTRTCACLNIWSACEQRKLNKDNISTFGLKKLDQ